MGALRRTRPVELVALVALVSALAVAVPAFPSDGSPRVAVTPAPRPVVEPVGTSAIAAAYRAAETVDLVPRHLIARPRGSSLPLHARPGGRVVTRLGATTEFGSPLRLAVVTRVRRWLGVISTTLPNGHIGWVDERRVALGHTDVSIRLDLSRRRLTLVKAGEVVRRMTVGVGRPGSPTPRGRFAVTDKIPGTRYGPYYGCCIVALSAHQTRLPAGWAGGDRIAIHGTNDPSSIGAATSAGCPHARASDLQALMRHVPLGAPVVVRA